MNELTIKIEYYNLWNKEFQNYLLSLKGITNVIKIGEDYECIKVEYNDDITLSIIIKEIQLYLEINNIPSISYFNKHLNSNLEEYIINIKHLCCEYCLYGEIEKLLYIDGINEVSTNFNYKEKYNIKVHIYYDKDKVSINELSKLEDNFNK